MCIAVRFFWTGIFFFIIFLSGCRPQSGGGLQESQTLPESEIQKTATSTPQIVTKTSQPPDLTPTVGYSQVVNTEEVPTATPELEIDTPGLFTPAAEARFQPWELISSMAWSQTGELLAVGVGDSLRLLSTNDPLTGIEEIAHLKIGAFTPGLAFSPDGSSLAAGSRDGWIRLWRVDQLLAGDYTPQWMLQAHKKGVNCIAFDPTGELLASGGNDAVVRFWDVATQEMRGQIIGGTFSVPSVAFYPSGNSVAILNGSVVRFRDTESGRMLSTMRGDTNFYSLTINKKGDRIAVGDHQSGIWVWPLSLETGLPKNPEEPLLFLPDEPDLGKSPLGLVWDLDYSPDARLLASAGGGGIVRVWDAVGGQIQLSFSGHYPETTSVMFSPDGKWLATGGLDGIIRLWSVSQIPGAP